MECKQEINKKSCTCTANCSNRGICCECVKHHRDLGQIPGCFFPPAGEKTYDRSIANFIKFQSNHT